jgi:hypothetical protein
MVCGSAREEERPGVVGKGRVQRTLVKRAKLISERLPGILAESGRTQIAALQMSRR